MKLTKKQILITGSALLAMFLGAGNLIFPPMLGQQAGHALWLAVLGFIVTGVGLPLLGITAVAKAGGDLEYLANRVHPTFSKIITTIVVLCIGPLLAIPRTAATTFEVAVVPFLHTTNTTVLSWGLVITSFIYFLITLNFVLRPSKLVDEVGKILTPLLVVFLAIIIIKGVINPLAGSQPGQYNMPFIEGFLQGYNTMDALASVIFGMVIVNAIRLKGVNDNKEIARVTVWAGVIAAVGLSSLYIGLAYIGATTGSTFTGSNPGQMLSYITESLLGITGKVMLAMAMTLACLTTSIGLVASSGNFFSRLSGYRISYNTVCIITTLLSFLLANMGLAKILVISVPLLVNVYPIIIVLVLLALFDNIFKSKRSVYITTTVGTVLAVLANLLVTLADKLGVRVSGMSKLLSLLPLQEQGLGWVLPAVVMAALGLFLKQKTGYQNEV
ncbi:branched-chain amino acid transport system II carrier protein [Desulfotomaculum varum]